MLLFFDATAAVMFDNVNTSTIVAALWFVLNRLHWGDLHNEFPHLDGPYLGILEQMCLEESFSYPSVGPH